jgi:hypothetical protein
MIKPKAINPFSILCFDEDNKITERVQGNWKRLQREICSMKVNNLRTYNKADFFDRFSNDCTKFKIKKINEAVNFSGSVTVLPDGNCVTIYGILITSYATYNGKMSIDKDSFLQEESFMNCVKMINVQVSCFSSRTVDRFRKNLPPSLWTGKYSIIDEFIVFKSGDFALAIQNGCVICAIPIINDIYIIYEITPQILECLRNYKITTLLNLSLLQEIFATCEFIKQLSCSVSIDIYFSNKYLDSFFGGGIQSLDAGVAHYVDSLTLNLFYEKAILNNYYLHKNSRVKWSGKPETKYVKGIVKFEEYLIPEEASDAYWDDQADEGPGFVDIYVNCKGEIPNNVYIKSPYFNCIYLYGLPIPWHGPPGMNFNDDFSLVSTNLELTWKTKPNDTDELNCCASYIKAKPIYGKVPIKYEVSDLKDLEIFEKQIRGINNILRIHPSIKNQFETQQLKRCFTPSIYIDSDYEIMFQIFYNLMFQRGTLRHLHTKNACYMISYLTNEKMKNLLLSRMNYIRVQFEKN